MHTRVQSTKFRRSSKRRAHAAECGNACRHEAEMPRGHSVESIRPDRRAHGFGGGANGVGGRVVIAGGRTDTFGQAARHSRAACVKPHA
ncbi:hypothetical protein DP59_5600 [Burkholderia pseudomallei]|nr:hypothetical protein DP59_5600 [Burkholderia pseudomallei]